MAGRQRPGKGIRGRRSVTFIMCKIGKSNLFDGKFPESTLPTSQDLLSLLPSREVLLNE
jgi:hypothetical protein